MHQQIEKSEGSMGVMDESVPEWIKEMHAYRNKHGYYRPGDVLRVLGDPAKRVQVPVVNALEAAKLLPQK